jgi:hypothetical protein
MVVPEITRPATGVGDPAKRAEAEQLPAIGAVPTILITIAVGVRGKSGSLMRSDLAESETKPFGVTGQEQQETISSVGSKAYTLAQTAPVTVASVPVVNPAPWAPVLVILITESPMSRFGTYLI